MKRRPGGGGSVDLLSAHFMHSCQEGRDRELLPSAETWRADDWYVVLRTVFSYLFPF